MKKYGVTRGKKCDTCGCLASCTVYAASGAYAQLCEQCTKLVEAGHSLLDQFGFVWYLGEDAVLRCRPNSEVSDAR